MSAHTARTAFDMFVADPLEKLVGSALHSVLYYALDGDMPDFDASDLVASGGCQGVRLFFDGGEAELDWGFEEEVRDPTGLFAYHLLVRSVSERANAEALCVVDATDAFPWKQVIDEPLRSATVWGVVSEGNRHIPQAVEFAFSSAHIFVTIGWKGHTVSVGDGDEVLVFSTEQWIRLRSEQFFADDWMIPLWQSSVAVTV